MDWVCEYCGQEGTSDAPVDEVQCFDCGEPAVPKR